VPGGSKYPGPPEALEAYTSVVATSGSDVAVKGARNPYTSRNGHMFSFLTAEGTLALRLSDELTAEFRANYESGDVIQYNSTMRGYSSIPADLVADTDTLAAWFDRSWDWIGTLPPK
jgi:hypothetical protein